MLSLGLENELALGGQGREVSWEGRHLKHGEHCM